MATTRPSGLRYWMLRTLEECDNASRDFSADSVHDLRVSIRRCRSLADGMIAMDPDPDWKAMKKTGKQLFQRLGALRDIQIMMGWVEKLELAGIAPERAERRDTPGEQAGGEPTVSVAGGNGGVDSSSGTTPLPARSEGRLGQPAGNPAHALLEILKAREAEQKHEARAALQAFDRKQWKQWAKTLPARAARIRKGSAVFKHLALERWTEARELHRTAMRNRSQVALHTLRIGIKRFRYIVENFLPAEHERWGDDLKHMQDLLGEVHDLDVLWATAGSCHIFHDAATRQRWHERVIQERTKRVAEYRSATVGEKSLWDVWRAGLPQGSQIHAIALERMKLWAKVLDPDFAHAERVAAMSLSLYDGLTASGLLRMGAGGTSGDRDLRDSLQAAALLHDVGKSNGKKGHHKESRALIQKHGVPLGWTAESMTRASLVARFHTGALPSRSHKALRDLLPDEVKNVVRLAAVLRLANALDNAHDGKIRRVRVEVPQKAPANGRIVRARDGFMRKPAPLGKNEAVVIAAEGYSDGTPAARTVAAERYLLETVLRRPVMVRAA